MRYSSSALTLPKQLDFVPLHQTFPSANSDSSNAAVLDLPTAMYALADLLDLGHRCEDYFYDFLFQWTWLEMTLMDRLLGFFLL
jgi:hypothetical protein